MRIYPKAEETRQELTQIFQANEGHPVYGLSEMLGIDKGCLTKSYINPLRERGHRIEACRGRKGGYIYYSDDPAEVRTQRMLQRVLCELQSLRLIVERLPSSVPGIPDIPEKRNQGSGTRHRGKKSIAPPETDTTQLVAVIGDAAREGRPFLLTSKSNGVHARRKELPYPYQGMGRDRLGTVVKNLVANGFLIIAEGTGFLTIPDK